MQHDTRRLVAAADQSRSHRASGLLRKQVPYGIYWGYIGVVEEKMETTGIMGIIWGLHGGLYWGYTFLVLKLLSSSHLGVVLVTIPDAMLNIPRSNTCPGTPETPRLKISLYKPFT